MSDTSASAALPGITLSVDRQSSLSNKEVVGGSERQLSGLKPIVPLKKRGQSFRETKNILASVDSAGRKHLNQ